MQDNHPIVENIVFLDFRTVIDMNLRVIILYECNTNAGQTLKKDLHTTDPSPRQIIHNKLYHILNFSLNLT